MNKMVATIVGEARDPVGMCELIGADAPVRREPPIQRKPMPAALALVPDPLIRRIFERKIAIGALDPAVVSLPEMLR